MSEPTPRSRNNVRKAPKLRASCDACSSAKVRCTQTKPSCARCSKHDVPCVYGISRRSGKRSAESYQAMRKNAEMEMEMSTSPTEIDMDFLDASLNLHSTGQSTPATSVNDLELNQPTHITANGLPTPPMAMNMDFLDSPTSFEFPGSPSTESLDSASHDQYRSSPDSCPDLPEYIKHQLKDWAFDNMFMTNLLPTPQISPKTMACPSFFDFEQRDPLVDASLNDYNFSAPNPADEAPSRCFKPSSIYSQSPTESDYMPFGTGSGDFSDNVIPSIECDSYFEHKPTPQPKRVQSSHANTTTYASHPGQVAASTHTCSCNESIITHLSLTPDSQDANKSYDMRLAQLQEILKLGSDVLNCACTTTNPSIPVSLSLLAARIVSILECLCHKAREDVSRGQGQTVSNGDRYSLGMYQIAKEDERRLKQEMLGLQIKKAELLVLCSKEVAGRSNRQMDTQAMVSDKLFSYLGEQVAEAKNGWAARNNDA
ncbi:Zn2/Cys6 DNA-binding protein [Glarea lozoyensis ATCC 20868]|uniref:Zn2/Cys6 DNA-binding protein n=1 Tax=Glarea lozoyensis (strain ATCC 20868 / MF5171) TaxID=1116229 RepID=S3EC64_GLAL2|nr:Zn2/Cys6 DNA-binding protein [Glarea lozoyensis ATCC 20868]EPE35893.1 Zn2/Cys6 DNA-binding protein [Glarea lozoyensis ATCC 20868]